MALLRRPYGGPVRTARDLLLVSSLALGLSPALAHAGEVSVAGTTLRYIDAAGAADQISVRRVAGT